MMNKLITILGGVFILVGIYIFVSKPEGTVAIIQTISSNAISGVKTLQGRG